MRRVTTKQQVGDTRGRVLDIAERLVQSRGFNGFSYADIAAELKITTASLHYHFAGKAELGRALIARYAERFFEALTTIDAGPSSAREKLRAYADLYADVLQGQRLCLCGMLAAEYHTLPDAMRESVVSFFDENEVWLAKILQQGRETGELDFNGTPEEAARMIIYGLEGAMLVARPYGGVARFHSAAEQLLDSLTTKRPSDIPKELFR
jgi:TetR/AcrR family transcriptional repressor of nem operon